MKVLLTAFEPFGGDRVNASADVLAAVAAGWVPGPVELETAVLPVSFDGGPRALAAAVERCRPDVVLCLGEAGGRTVVTPEAWAAPEADARIPDNDGDQPAGRPLDDADGPLASRLDPEALALAVRAAGVPAAVSKDAGRFVCNAVFRAALTGFHGPAGFVHVPALRPPGATAGVGAETDAAAPATAAGGLTVDDLAAGVTAAVLAAAGA